jgi:hypothetical protein
MAGKNEPPSHRQVRNTHRAQVRTPSFSFIFLILGVLGVFAVQKYLNSITVLKGGLPKKKWRQKLCTPES